MKESWRYIETQEEIRLYDSNHVFGGSGFVFRSFYCNPFCTTGLYGFLEVKMRRMIHFCRIPVVKADVLQANSYMYF